MKMYLKLQLKKAFKLYPAIILVTIITLTSIAATCVALLSNSDDKNNQQKITIGVVGDADILYDIAQSGLYIDFVDMTEEEAQYNLKMRKINGYVRIPPRFIQGIYYGRNNPAQYIMLNSGGGVGTLLVKEIVGIVSDMVVETQNGIYSLQVIEEDYNMDEKVYENINELNFSYMDFTFTRDEVFKIDLLGVTDRLTMGGYYVVGILFFFMLIWSISCNKLLGGRNLSLSRALNSRGISVISQLVCEYLSYLAVTMVTLLGIAFIMGTVANINNFGIYELEGMTVMTAIGYIIKILPVIIMITLMQMMFYELVPGTVGSILMQFILAVGLGYVSGCFYPNYFFPQTMQDIASYLPTGVGFSYMRKTMSETLAFSDFLYVSVYAVLFGFITFIVRKRRIAGDEK